MFLENSVSILIDGHNLIGQLKDLSLTDPDDEAKLVQRLRVYRNVANRPITVIFDSGATYCPPHNLSGGGVEAIFASVNSSADRHIISRIKHSANPCSLLVVSSDHEIQAVARSRGAGVLTSQEFARKMTHTHAPKHERRKRVSREQALSAREVDEWLVIFQYRPK